MFEFLRKTPTVVGLDISSTAVKLLELSQDKGQYRVESYGLEVIPDDSRGNAPSLVQPPANHERAYLEQFNIASLSLVGSLEIGSSYYGLIKDQDGLIHQVGVGDYLGTQWGRIERIEEAHVELVEIVSNGGGGWLRRPRTIEMNQAGE